MKKPLNIKKLVLLNLPYLLMGLFATNFGEAWRMAQGADASEKVLSLISVLPAALGSFWPSFHPLDLLVGLCCGAALADWMCCFSLSSTAASSAATAFPCARISLSTRFFRLISKIRCQEQMLCPVVANREQK